MEWVVVLRFGLKECAVGIVWVALRFMLGCDPDVHVCIYLIPVDYYLDVTGKKRDYLEEAVVQGSIGKRVEKNVNM